MVNYNIKFELRQAYMSGFANYYLARINGRGPISALRHAVVSFIQYLKYQSFKRSR